MSTPINPYQSPTPITADADCPNQRSAAGANDSLWFVSNRNESLLSLFDRPWISPKWFAYANLFWFIGICASLASMLPIVTEVLRRFFSVLGTYMPAIVSVAVGMVLAFVWLEYCRSRATRLDRVARLTSAAAIQLPPMSPSMLTGLTDHVGVVWGHLTTTGLLFHTVNRSVAIPQTCIITNEWLNDGWHLSVLKSKYSGSRQSVVIQATDFVSTSPFVNRTPLKSELFSREADLQKQSLNLPQLAEQLLADRDQLFGLLPNQDPPSASETNRYAGTLYFGDQHVSKTISMAFIFLPLIATAWAIGCSFQLYGALIYPLTWQPRAAEIQAALSGFVSPLLVFVAGLLFYLVAKFRLIPIGETRGLVTPQRWTILADCSVIAFADDLITAEQRLTFSQWRRRRGAWQLGFRPDCPVHVVPARIFHSPAASPPVLRLESD